MALKPRWARLIDDERKAKAKRADAATNLSSAWDAYQALRATSAPLLAEAAAAITELHERIAQWELKLHEQVVAEGDRAVRIRNLETDLARFCIQLSGVEIQQLQFTSALRVVQREYQVCLKELLEFRERYRMAKEAMRVGIVDTLDPPLPMHYQRTANVVIERKQGRISIFYGFAMGTGVAFDEGCLRYSLEDGALIKHEFPAELRD
jgi:hypothetical protein